MIAHAVARQVHEELPGIFAREPLSRLLERAVPSSAGGWCIEALAGRLVQLEGPSSLTLACTVVRESQERGEPVAWITVEQGIFYPPDVHDNGVELDALPVVRLPDAAAVFSAADLCLRSGAFGLIVADLGPPPSAQATACASRRRGGASRGRVVPPADPRPATMKLKPADPRPATMKLKPPGGVTALARLAGLARRHLTTVVFLTRPGLTRRQAQDPDASLGSLISLHVRAERDRAGADQFRCRVTVLKDKHRGPVWRYEEVRRGAVGLR